VTHNLPEEHEQVDPVGLGRLLNLVSSSIQTVGERALAPAGITLSQWKVLGTLWQDEPLRVTDLAARMRLDQAATSRLVARLERQGHLERAPHPEDGRSTQLALSESGRQAARQCAALLAPVLPRVMEGLEEEQLAALLRALRRLDANLEALLEEVGR
jgi:MarR family transcriptional regulator, transcriptional regulator for hemolysin